MPRPDRRSASLPTRVCALLGEASRAEDAMDWLHSSPVSSSGSPPKPPDRRVRRAGSCWNASLSSEAFGREFLRTVRKGVHGRGLGCLFGSSESATPRVEWRYHLASGSRSWVAHGAPTTANSARG